MFYSIVPPERLTTFVYHCGDRFLLDPLRKNIEQKENYGLITVGRKRAAIGYLKGSRVELKKEFTSHVHQNHKAGGQSAPRFQRKNREDDQRFYQKIGEKINEIFLPIKDLSGIFIGGSGHSKLRFIAEGRLDRNLKSKIIDVVNIGYDGGMEGIHALINKIQEQIKHVRYIKERLLIDEFLGALARNSDSVSYGFEETHDLLEKGLIRKILVSEQFEGMDEVLNISKLKKIPFMVISTETSEGKLLYDTFGGIVGFLKRQ